MTSIGTFGSRFNRVALVVMSEGGAAGAFSAVLLCVLWRTIDVPYGSQRTNGGTSEGKNMKIKPND